MPKPYDKRLVLKLDRPLLLRFDRMCAANGVTRSHAIRTAIEQYLVSEGRKVVQEAVDLETERLGFTASTWPVDMEEDEVI